MYSFNTKNAVFELIHWTNNDRIVNDSEDKGIHGTSMKDLLAVYSDGEERLRMRILYMISQSLRIVSMHLINRLSVILYLFIYLLSIYISIYPVDSITATATHKNKTKHPFHLAKISCCSIDNKRVSRDCSSSPHTYLRIQLPTYLSTHLPTYLPNILHSARRYCMNSILMRLNTPHP